MGRGVFIEMATRVWIGRGVLTFLEIHFLCALEEGFIVRFGELFLR
jgi:hypothetical protein